MKSKIWIIIVAIVASVAMMALCVVGIINSDKTAPTINFEPNDTVYIPGMDNESLLQGVKAVDSHDGDVSNRIVIEKIIEKKDTNQAVVYYAVSDMSGNVSKASRLFGADYSAMGDGKENADDVASTEDSVDTNTTVQDSETDMQNDSSADIAEADTDANLDENSDENTEAGEATDEIGAETDTADSEAQTDAERVQELEDELAKANERADKAEAELNTMKNADAKRKENERKQEEAANNNIAQTENPAPTETTVAGSAPAIILKSTEITTAVGVAPAWVSCIQSLTDDKDSYAELFSSLSYTKYDTNSKGPHRVALTVKDKDGNVSAPAYVTVNVK